jgi:nucleoid DNA-binding protein
MAKNKTAVTNASVGDFIKAVIDTDKRADCKTIMAMMRAATGKRARMWGGTIVGFGSYEYRYASGKEGEWPLTGLSPRAQNIAIYVMPGFEKYKALLKKLGKHKIGKSCLYIKRLSDVDESVLNTLIERSVKDMNKKYNSG